MDTLTSADVASQQWTKLLETCFKRRIRPEHVRSALQELSSQQQLVGLKIANIILSSGSSSTNGIDPLLPAYLEQLLQQRLMDTADLLIVSLNRSQYVSRKTTTEGVGPSIQNNFSLQETVLALVARLYAAGERPKTTHEPRRAVRALAEWLLACNYYATELQIQGNGLYTPEPALTAVFESLGLLAITVLSNDSVKHILSQAGAKGMPHSV